ncbi:PH domain-containing protein [Ornithinibacillus sp. 179-J 7C1 HS]
MLWIWFGTGYQVKGELLVVRIGPFKGKIKIKEILKIRSIKNPNTSSTLFVDKLEILFGKYDVIRIFPQNNSKLIQVAVVGGIPAIPVIIIAFLGNLLTILLLIAFVDSIRNWRKKKKGNKEKRESKNKRAKNI